MKVNYETVFQRSASVDHYIGLIVFLRLGIVSKAAYIVLKLYI